MILLTAFDKKSFAFSIHLIQDKTLMVKLKRWRGYKLLLVREKNWQTPQGISCKRLTLEKPDAYFDIFSMKWNKWKWNKFLSCVLVSSKYNMNLTTWHEWHDMTWIWMTPPPLWVECIHLFQQMSFEATGNQSTVHSVSLWTPCSQGTEHRCLLRGVSLVVWWQKQLMFFYEIRGLHMHILHLSCLHLLFFINLCCPI